MVVLSNFRDVFNDSLEQKNISLPTIKQSFLKVDFEKNDVRLPKNTAIIYQGQEPPLPFAVGKAFDATICNWRRLTEESADCKTVYEVTLDVTASNFNFRPGDTIGVIPQNLDEEVDIIIDHLDLLSVVDLSYRISIISGQKGSKVPAHIPVCSTLRHVFKHCIDLRGVVKKLFLLTLSKYTKDKAEKKALEYLCSKEGASFLEERQWLDSKNVEQGPVWLFFGCRHPDLDYIYEKELGNFVSTGVLNKLTTTFSRVNSETKYVQDALLYHGQEVARLLKEGALVYVCGDVKTLSVQVKDVLVKCLIEFEDNTPEEAEKFVCDMQKGKRYLVDSWN
ncbi:unnamed protein product, partial [Iphiclides podalirius]